MPQIRAIVRIKAYGNEMERFFNLCMNHDISIQHMNILSDSQNRTCYLFSMNANDYLKVKSFIRKTNIKTKIIQKSGVPFVLKRIIKRTFFGCLILCSILFIYIMMMRIWKIEVTGNFLISDDVFYDFLEENQIYYGSKSSDINFNEVEEKIRETFSDITWASVTKKGTALIIQVREREVLPTVTDQSTTGDLIATQNGIVESIIVRRGVPMVRAGDVVEKGQILVLGKLDLYNDDLTVRESRYVSADADISIVYQKEIILSLNKTGTRKIYTGNSKKNSYLKIGTLYLTNPFHKDEFSKQETIVDIKQFCIFNHFYLPAYFGSVTTKEYFYQQFEYSFQDAEEYLSQKFNELLSSFEEKGLQILEKNVKIELSGTIYKLTGSVSIAESAYEREYN